MNTGLNGGLDHTRRSSSGTPKGKRAPGGKLEEQRAAIEELAKIYLTCLEAMQPKQSPAEHRELSPEKKTDRGRYFFQVCFDWKFALAAEIFAVWALKSFVIPLLK